MLEACEWGWFAWIGSNFDIRRTIFLKIWICKWLDISVIYSTVGTVYWFQWKLLYTSTNNLTLKCQYQFSHYQFLFALNLRWILVLLQMASFATLSWRRVSSHLGWKNGWGDPPIEVVSNGYPFKSSPFQVFKWFQVVSNGDIPSIQMKVVEVALEVGAKNFGWSGRFDRSFHLFHVEGFLGVS